MFWIINIFDHLSGYHDGIYIVSSDTREDAILKAEMTFNKGKPFIKNDYDKKNKSLGCEKIYDGYSFFHTD